MSAAFRALTLSKKARGFFDRGTQTVIHDGRAFRQEPAEPFRNSLRGGSRDLLEAAKWGKKPKRPRRPRKLKMKR